MTTGEPTTVQLHHHLPNVTMTSVHPFQGSPDAYIEEEYADWQMPDLSDIHMT